MRVHDMQFEVSSGTGSERVPLATTVFLPEELPQRLQVLMCAPGGSYNREYWHPSNLDASYSFASAMTDRGFVLVTMDALGTGESGRPSNSDDLTLERAATAYSEVLAQVRARLADGSLVPGVGPVANVQFIGVGHSLGGCISLIQQSMFADFAALAVLSWANQPVATMYEPHERESELTPEERRDWARQTVPEKFFGSPWEKLSEYINLPRDGFNGWFHADDVPAEVISAEETAAATVLPRTFLLEGIIPGFTTSYAAKVASPVFLNFAMVNDVCGDPHAEVLAYPQSHDVTLFELPGASHCTNYASTRSVLWNRLAAWAAGFSHT